MEEMRADMNHLQQRNEELMLLLKQSQIKVVEVVIISFTDTFHFNIIMHDIWKDVLSKMKNRLHKNASKGDTFRFRKLF